MPNPKRKEFLERLRQYLDGCSINKEVKDRIWRYYLEWGDYCDKRFFNNAQVITQFLTGRFKPDKELKELVTPIVSEMVLALEDFVMKNIVLQIKLLETGNCSLDDLESPLSSMRMFQEVALETMEWGRKQLQGERKELIIFNWKGQDYIVRRWNWYPPGEIELKDKDTGEIKTIKGSWREGGESDEDYHEITNLLQNMGITPESRDIDPHEILTD